MQYVMQRQILIAALALLVAGAQAKVRLSHLVGDNMVLQQQTEARLWGWAKPDSLIDNLPRAKENTKEYIDRHLAICERIKKPLVMEEFGYPRDDFKFELETPTRGRDGFYEYVFSLVGDNAEQGGYFAGCNFWGWGGLAKPKHTDQWQVGDDYTGDPAQEAQGLNSVFAGDTSTLQIIKSQVDRMNELTK